MHTRVPFSWVSLAAAAVSAVSFSHFHGNRKRTCVALHGFTSSTAVITMFLSLCDLPFRQMVCVCLSVCACPPSLLVLLSHWWWSDGDDQVTRVTLARTCASSPHFFFFCFLHRGSFRFCTARHPFRGMCRSA